MSGKDKERGGTIKVRTFQEGYFSDAKEEPLVERTLVRFLSSSEETKKVASATRSAPPTATRPKGSRKKTKDTDPHADPEFSKAPHPESIPLPKFLEQLRPRLLHEEEKQDSLFSSLMEASHPLSFTPEASEEELTRQLRGLLRLG
jgi:hypothetical protein